MAAEVILIACEREPYRAFYIVSDRVEAGERVTAEAP
jgi:hypothetical protein